MKSMILTTVACILTASTAMADGQEKTIRLGTEGAYPPYNFINDAGEVDGFERELGDELCKRAELTCEWVTNEWDSIIPNLVSGNYDVIIAGMAVTDERDAVIDFSEQYTLPEPSGYLATSAGVDIKTGIVATQASTVHASFIASSDATLVEFATPEESVAAVKNGEADAVLADKAFLVELADADAELIMLEQEEKLGGGIALGIRESDTELKDKFNVAIKSMKEDGSLNVLIGKWLPKLEQF